MVLQPVCVSDSAFCDSWAVHRGGALFFEDAEAVRVENCSFHDVGGNALFFSNHVAHSAVRGCEFKRVGDSAISLVGDAESINVKRKGDATCSDECLFPEYNVVEMNTIHEVGITGKGMAGYFQSIARSNVIRRNVMFNGPRAA
eukprot:COSAG01_NODE_35788_length_526_cov_1.693208_1_plen_143_part_01